MRRFAATVSILGFFVLAGVGLVSDVRTFDCAMRALGGAVVIYVVVSIAMRIVLNIVVDAVINGAPASEDKEGR